MTAPARTSRRRDAEARLADRRQAGVRPSDHPLVWVALAAGIGWIASTIGGPPIVWLLLAIAGLGGWAVARRPGRDTTALASLMLAVLAVSGAWTSADWRWFSGDEIGLVAQRDAQPIALEAIAASAPVVYPADEASPFEAIPPTDRTVIRVEVVGVRHAREWRPASGRSEVSIAGRLESVAPGDRIVVFGQIRSPRPASNPGERDAARAARAERRLAVVFAEAPECVTLKAAGQQGHGERLRNWSAATIEERLPGEAALLAKAMLLGDRSGLTQETIEAFRRTATLHVLVVSGLHVGIAAGLLPALAALGLLPRRVAWIGALALVILYGVLVEASPPALRAGVAAAAACLAAIVGRRPLSINSLAGAALAVLAVSPGAWTAAGTKLSFLAAASLLGVAAFAARRRSRLTPPLERLIESTRGPVERTARRFAAWSGWVVAATLVVQLATGPLVASEFHLVSPAAAPLALLVSPLIATTVSAGLASLAWDSIGLGVLADGCGSLCGVAAGGLGCAVQAVSQLPSSAIWVAGPATWWVAAWVTWLATVGGCWAYRLPMGRLLRFGVAGLAATYFAPALIELATHRDELRCSFLAVGHGSATLIEPAGGGAILIDAGALGSSERVADTVARVLWARGIERIDAVMLTHPDIDHYNAIPALLERFPIDVVYTTTRMFSRVDDPADRSGPAELRRRLLQEGVPIRTLQMGDRLPIGETTIEVLHPDDLGVIGSDNANSLVLGVEFADQRVLLPGDLESPGVEAVLAQEPYDCDVLLAPHHGSRLSNPPGFAAWCRPEKVVISSGESRGEAEAAYTAAGASVWTTHRMGMITAVCSSDGTKVFEFP